MQASDKKITFTYEGLDRNGKSVAGNVLAENKKEAATEVRKLGVAATRIKTKSNLNFSLTTQKKITQEEVVNLSRQLATMLKAGLPLVQSFDVAAESSNKQNIRAFILSLRSEVAAGRTFSDALKKYPEIFDDLYCNLVAAGEISGTLDVMLDRIASFLEKNQRLKANIKKALTYPISVLGVAIIVTAILLIKVVPSFESSFASFGAELPAFTQFVIGISDIAQEYWLWLLGIFILTIVMFNLAQKKSPRFVYLLDQYMLKVPVLGNVIYLGAMARFARTLSTTFASGIPMLDAIDSSAGAAGNRHITSAVMELKVDVAQGSLVNVAMKKNTLFPPLLQQLTMVGEESGSLEIMINKAAETYEDSVNDAVDALTALIDPVIMSFLAVVIGGLMMAMYLPIFTLGSVI
jgi:type IV pilus assembly protein PilC